MFSIKYVCVKFRGHHRKKNLYVPFKESFNLFFRLITVIIISLVTFSTSYDIFKNETEDKLKESK